MKLLRASLDVPDVRTAQDMLRRLPGRERVAFLQWCCRQSPGAVAGHGVRVTSSTGELLDVFMDLQMLEGFHGLDLRRVALPELERRLRRR